MGVDSRGLTRRRNPSAGSTVEVLGLEVVQAIQNPHHEVPLIADKATIVRAYLKPDGLNRSIRVRGEIAVKRAGSMGELYLPSLGTMMLRPDPAPGLPEQRQDIELSLNFRLPDALIAAGKLNIRFHRVIPVNGNDVALSDHAFSVDTEFEESAPLRIHAVGLRYRDPSNNRHYSPDAVHFEYLRSFLRRAYPVAQVEWSQIVIDAHRNIRPPFSGPLVNNRDPRWEAQLSLAHMQLKALRAKDISEGGDARVHYCGLISAERGFFRGAASAVPAQPAPGTVAVLPAGSGLLGDHDLSYADWYGSHELAHTFGRLHPGFCNGNSDDDGSFPYPDGRISHSAGDFVGLDVGDEALGLPMRALPNDDWHDLMTYCENQWVSPYTYEGIRARLAEEDADFG